MFTVILVIAGMQAGYASPEADQRKPVRILILPKFEVGAMAGDFPGEAQCFYEEYLAGGDSYILNGCPDTIELYYKDGIALCAVGQAVKCFGMLDRLIILRVGVNMDVFPEGVTPEILWRPASDDHLASEESMESVDIFETAMHNCFSVGKVLIDTILDGSF